MKKTTGKVVSLVLALALVVTSFSGTFAFASTTSVSGTVSGTTHDEIYLSNSDVTGTTTNTTVVDLQTNWIDAQLDTKDHQTVEDEHIAAISHASGDTLVKWSIDDNDIATLTLKSTSKTGKEVLSILYEGSYVNDDGDTVTVKARKDFTVNVLEEGSLVIGTDGSANGESVDMSTFAQTKNSTQTLHVYKVAPSGDTGLLATAEYTPVQVTTYTKASDADTDGTPGVDSDVVVALDKASISTTGDIHLAATGTTITATVGKNYDSDTSKYLNDGAVANVTITAKRILSDGASTPVYSVSTDTDDKYTLKTKIEKKVDVKALFTGAVDPTYTIDKDGSKTKLYSPTLTAGVVVTDTEVVFPSTTTSVIFDDGSVKKISGVAGILTINDGSVASVDVNNTNVNVVDGNVGDITTDADTAKTGIVVVTDGKVGNIDTTDVADADAGKVTINGGTIGTIASDDAVLVEATDEDTAIVTGKITANDVTAFSDEAKVSINGIKASDDGSILVKGDTTTVGALDFDYRTVTLTLGDDDDAFTGTVTAPANAVNGTIASVNEDTVATVTGTVKVDSISVGSDSDLKFTDAITVDSIDGDGTLTIAAGKLYVTGGVSGTTLKLSDATLAKGTTVFKADSDTVADDDFTCYGFTLATSAGTDVDTFKIDTLEFAGLTINKSTSDIAKGYSETFTASAYPGGTTLPAGSTITWDLDGSTDVFEVTSSGNTATVKVLSVDTDFASENTAKLTATLYDADGYVYDDYSVGTVTVNAIAVPAATSDTKNDLSVAAGASYTFKITSATAPTFTTGTAGVFTVALASHTGNDYFYKITATGKVGAATGIFINGTKLLVASVKAGFTSDTNKDVTVKGAYTVKITSATVPTFGVGTAGVVNAAFVTKTGNDYFYKLTSVGAVGTKAGVFVNGVKIFVATVG